MKDDTMSNIIKGSLKKTTKKDLDELQLWNLTTNIFWQKTMEMRVKF